MSSPLLFQKISLFLMGMFLILTISSVSGEIINPESVQPYRVGVLLPGSGDSAMDFFEILNWTAEELNREGVGAPIELVSVDTSTIPISDAGKQMLSDPSIQVVIGPATSDETFQLSPDFIEAKKILITPSATSGKISNMFSPSGYIWRTTGGDRIQTRIIMELLSEKGATSIALLYENNTYGKTFADWADVYSLESGMNLTGVVSFEPGGDLSGPITHASSGNPDYLIVAARGSHAAEITRIMHEQNNPAKIFFTDAVRSETFTEIAGAEAEGAEGVSPTADKKTGFFVTYQEHFGKMPSDYSALTRDALVLALATLARMEAYPTEEPSDAIKNVVSGKVIQTAWDDQGTAQAIRLIRAGYLPDLTGASGPLDYDSFTSTDPLTTWYVHWRVEEGKFLADSYIPGSMGGEQEPNSHQSPSIGETIPSTILVADPRSEVSFVYSGEKGDFGFTDQAFLGLIEARNDMNLTVRELFTGDSESEPDPVIDTMTGKKASVVIMLGSYMTGYAEQVAKQYPDVPVIVIDANPISVPNIKTASFSMYGASYLAGILAANQTNTGKIAVIAGRKAQVIDSFTDGFIQGAASEDPHVLVNITCIADDNSGYSQPDKGEEIAEDMYRNGTDIIFTVAGGSGLGVISAAKRLSGLKIIGVDSDQSYLGPGVVIASVVKNLEPVVYREIKDAIEGSYAPGLEVNNLANNGSTLAINPRFSTLSTVIEGRIYEVAEQEAVYASRRS